ncbi:large ribosomal subunit protein bL21m isoform X1 [Coffea arabica]|uniref:Large ribosomal subunit protein bL21m n=1 Tax=Coffea arabica TaxID=13443 RepID=A0A6P6VDG1_COFAR
MANRRCIQTLISRCFCISHSPNPSPHPILKTLTIAPHFLLQTEYSTVQSLTPTDPGKICSAFPSFSRHLCSDNRTSMGSIDNDGDEEEEEEEDDDDDESEDEERVHLSGKSDEQKAEEAAEIGYKVIGLLEESDRVFKPYEPVFAVVQVGSHQFKVSNGDSIFVEKLKYCDVNDKLILNRVLMLGSTAQTIIGRPVLPDAAVHAVVEEHALDAKVIIFKKKRRKNYRRTKGHRQELTKLRITDIQGIAKPEPIPSMKTEKRATKKVEKTAVSA